MNKKAKDGGFILVIILVAAIFAGFYLWSTNAAREEFITVGLYDAEGNKITTNNLFSVVQGVEGVAQIDFTINVNNIGETELVCDLISGSPSQLNTALPTNLLTIPKAQSSSWTSSKIDVQQFEGMSQPVSFSASVECEYEVAGQKKILGPKSGAVELTIQPDASGDFTVSVEGAGESGSSGGSTVSTGAIFRTTSTTYGPGSEIGIANSCGDSLTGFKHVFSSTSTGGLCSTTGFPQRSNAVYLFDVPGGWLSGGNPARLYQENNFFYLFVCDDNGNAAQFRQFSPRETISVIDTSANSINPALEVAC